MGLLLIAACCAGVLTAGPVAAQEQDPPASGQVTPVVVEPPTDEERQALADCLADPACAPYVPSSAETGFTVREVGAAEEPALDAAFDVPEGAEPAGLDEIGEVVDSGTGPAASDVTVEAGEPGRAVQAAAAAKTKTKVVDRWVRVKYPSGQTAYLFHNVTRWRYNGKRVLPGVKHRHYMSEIDGWTVDFDKITSETLEREPYKGIPSAVVRSVYQAKVRHCVVKQGCFATTYPFVEIRGWRNGSVGWTTRY